MNAAEKPMDRARAFRDCVGSFATGVCIVASEHKGARAGMTVNSFTSVSLDPLLVLVSLKDDSRTRDAVRASGWFSVSMLGAGQRRVALDFASPGSAFPDHHIERTSLGLKVRGAVAHLRCEVQDVFCVADHDLVIGGVVDFVATEGAPLVFHRGGLGHLSAHGERWAENEILERFGW